MEILRKSRKKLRSVMVVSTTISLVFAGLACQGSAPSDRMAIDRGDAKAAADRLAEADELYEGREDLNKARVCVAALRQARTADYGNYEAAWKLARAAFYVGDRSPNNSEKDDMFREGVQAGKAAVALQPDKPEGHFWLGANYGGEASQSTLANLSSVHDIKNEMETVLKIDESYEGHSAYLGLGRLYLQAPKVLGGDTAKAIQYLEKGVKLSPNNTMMRFHLAEAYVEANRDAEAKKQIETIMKTTPDPKYTAEHTDAVAKAQKLLQKIG
ncbi:MAG TPA: TRAP transporter TatT component family protein [Pyrinomonadaceae bacterium]|nr:TRAP transporter TatT component family protein [Pyrinomonadaceae bacterium]